MKQFVYIALILALSACSESGIQHKSDRTFLVERGPDAGGCVAVTAYAPSGDKISEPHKFCDGWVGLSCGDTVIARAKRGNPLAGFVAGPKFASPVELEAIGKKYPAQQSPQSRLNVSCEGGGIKLTAQNSESSTGVQIDAQGRVRSM